MRDEGDEDGDERADDFPAGFGFGLADLAGRGAAQACDQIDDGAPAAVGVLPDELGEALLPEARGALRCGVAGEEREGDRGIDVGEEAGGPGPEPLEQSAELIGEGEALGDEVVSAAHEGSERARVVGGRAQGPEPVAIGPEQVGEDEGVAQVGLTAGGRVPGPTRLERVRVDRHYLEPGLEEGVDEHARGPFEGDADEPAPAKATQVAEELGEALGGMWDGALPVNAAGFVQDADGVGQAGPVDADQESHCVASVDGETLRGERSCRSLTDWRSGLLGHLARHPVAGLGLSSFGSGERVSYWPSSGERAWLSPNVDHLASLSPLDRARTADFRGRVVQ